MAVHLLVSCQGIHMTLSQDLKYAYRQLVKSPAFTFIALGVGATTAMFTVIHNVLLKPLPYPDPQQLVTIRENIPTPNVNVTDLPVNANHLLFWREHNHSFSQIVALMPSSMPLGNSPAEEIGVAHETANLHSLLGIQPRLGRAFLPEEEKPGHKVVILTDGLWKRSFNADPAIIGKAITLDGKPYQVVGVLPSSFTLPNSKAIGGLNGTSRPIEAFVPFGWTAEQLSEVEGSHNYFAIGRLKPGVTIQQAALDLNSLQQDILRQVPDKFTLSAIVIPFQEYLVGSSRNALLVLLAAVAALLLIACINITNLLLARAAGRQHEAAVRLALGASHAQLLKSALAEPVLLATMGGLCGTLLAYLALPALLRDLPSDLPRIAEVHLDLPVLAFAFGISLLSAIVCGLLPAWRQLRGTPQLALRAEARTASDSHGTKRLRRALVIGEVTTSVMLVVLAGLFVTSMIKLLHVDRGFQAEHVLSAQVALPDKQYGDDVTRNAFFDQALLRLRQLPGVESAGTVSVLPLDGDRWGDFISTKSDTRPVWERPAAHFRWMTPGYLETLRVPLVAGRFLTEEDRGKNVAILSRQAAEATWPGQSAIGQHFTRMDPSEPPFEVVGVVGDVRSLDLSKPMPKMVYVPHWYRSNEVASFVIRTSGDPAAMASVLRKTIWSVDSQVAIPNIRTMDTVIEGSVAARRFQMHLLLLFAACSLLLAALGIYGVVTYTTAQRTQEIGIRMALGASYSDVYRLILSEGITPVIIGSVLGVVLASLGGRILASLLFEVKPDNPMIAATACAILITVGVLACLLPARRATKIEPIQALRYE
jgi:predicted permease